MYETISYEDICRLCISKSKSVDIFSAPPDLQIFYSDIIQTLVQIKFTENELNELPKGICNECANKLVQFYNFKIQTEVSQVELLKLLGENLDEEQQEQNSEIDLGEDFIITEEQCDNVLLDDTVSQFYEGHESFDYEMNNTNMVEYFHESNLHKEIKLEESSKLLSQAENLEEYSILEDEIENSDKDNINKKPEECVEKYDASPKFTLIENTEQLSAEEQFLWQKKLAKWVTKLPRGKRKSKHTVEKTEEKVKKVFQCETCDRLFSSKAAERNHQTVHTGEKNFECEICHKRFTRIYHVKDHLRIHQGIQPYKCDVCGKCFTKNSDLHRHKRIHSNKAMYTCVQCGKEFKWKTSFDIHLNSHSGIKAFKCTKCNNAYTSGCSLKKHQIKYNHL